MTRFVFAKWASVVLAGLLLAPSEVLAEGPLPICTAPGDQSAPAIDQGKIVWVDDRYLPDGGSAIFFDDYYRYNPEAPICTTSGRVRNPSISGNRIVWEDYRNADTAPDIYMYDLTTGQETAICTALNEQEHPDISGDLIVWEDMRNETDHFTRTNDDIYMYNLATGQETAICTDPAVQGRPSISGQRIVWDDSRNMGPNASDIYMYDLATGQETPICPNPAYQDYPKISGDIIVWQDNRNGDWDVYMYDLASGVESPVCALRGSTQQYPDVGEGWIVWEDNRNGDWDIYMFDVEIQREVPICLASPSFQVAPAVSKQIVVWSDTRSGRGDYDIYAWLRTGSQPCYPSTAYSARPKDLALLRRFRDEVLAKLPGGPALIRLHYRISPTIAVAMQKNEGVKNVVTKALDAILPLVKLTLREPISGVVQRGPKQLLSAPPTLSYRGSSD